MRIAIVDVNTLTRNWWVVLLRGVAGVAFGIITVMAPGISLAALVLLWGAYAFADGVLALVTAIRRVGEGGRWWLLLLEGLVGIAAGVLTLLIPSITAIALLYLIAAWALVTGALEIAAAIRLRKVISNEWLLALSGVASLIFGVLLIVFPRAGTPSSSARCSLRSHSGSALWVGRIPPGRRTAWPESPLGSIGAGG
jgi:uncharacterized membrane protein HdeD (DUF308 family)